MPAWLNASSGIDPENGTAVHAIPLGFTASAGCLLVVVVGGQVTHTGPAGWTEQLQPVNFTELSVFTRTAAGGETNFTDTNNGADYPLAYAAYQFPAGSAWVTGTGQTNGTAGVPPNGITGLPGTACTVLCALDRGVPTSADVLSSTWASGWTKHTDLNSTPGTKAIGMVVGYLDGVTATSAQPDVAVTRPGGTVGAFEAVTFAVSVPTGGPPSYAGTLAASGSGSTALSGSPAAVGALASSGSGTGSTGGTPVAGGTLAATSSGTSALAGTPALGGSLARSGTGTATLTPQAGPSEPPVPGGPDVDLWAMPPFTDWRAGPVYTRKAS